MKTLTKEELAEFVRTHDFAFANNAGLDYSSRYDLGLNNDIADWIIEHAYDIHKMDLSNEDERFEAGDFEDEIKNGSDVYKIFTDDDNYPFYVAYYED